MSFDTTRWGLALVLAAALCQSSYAQDDPAAPPAEEAEADVQFADPAADDAMAMFEPASKEDMSYAIGFTIGMDMAGRDADMDTEELIQGLRAGLGDAESRMSDAELSQCLFSFQMQMQQKFQQAIADNLAKGQAYLAENGQKEGVTTTESGLQYKVIKSGDGATPTIDDVVSAHYKGTLIDGTEFDSSPEGEPVPFPIGRVIPAWTEALLMMKVGDKWELTVPANLAYGERGSPDGTIGPNEVLIFEVELAEIIEP